MRASGMHYVCGVEYLVFEGGDKVHRQLEFTSQYQMNNFIKNLFRNPRFVKIVQTHNFQEKKMSSKKTNTKSTKTASSKKGETTMLKLRITDAKGTKIRKPKTKAEAKKMAKRALGKSFEFEIDGETPMAVNGEGVEVQLIGDDISKLIKAPKKKAVKLSTKQSETLERMKEGLRKQKPEPKEEEKEEPKKAGKKKEAAPKKKPAVKRRKGPGNHKIMNDLLREGCTDEQLVEKFTAIYAEQGKTDAKWIAGRVAIYKKLELRDNETKEAYEKAQAAKAKKPAKKRSRKKTAAKGSKKKSSKKKASK